MRNDEFDRGESAGSVKYAYEILRLEELEQPWTLAALKRNGWLGGAPQKYCFVKGEMVAALGDVSLRLVFDSGAALRVRDEDDESRLGAAPQVARRGQLKRGPSAGVKKSISQSRRISDRRQASFGRWLAGHPPDSDST